MLTSSLLPSHFSYQYGLLLSSIDKYAYQSPFSFSFHNLLSDYLSNPSLCIKFASKYLSLFLPRNHNKLTLKHLEASGIYLCHKCSRLKSAYFTSGQPSIKTKISTLHLRTCSIRFHILALQSHVTLTTQMCIPHV